MTMTNIQSIIDNYSKTRNHIRVLEAGCGSASYVKFKKNTYLIGIDISELQLKRNDMIYEKILGDIQYYDLPLNSFDIIICWYVLEHLSKPELAMKNFSNSIKNNGLIILALPNVLSLKGIITKFTPHWFHVFIFKYLFGRKDAGRDDVAPFKTYLRFSITLSSIKKFADKNDLKIKYISNNNCLDDWMGLHIKEKNKLFYFILKYLDIFLKNITFGIMGPSEIIMVLEKETESN